MKKFDLNIFGYAGKLTGTFMVPLHEEYKLQNIKKFYLNFIKVRNFYFSLKIKVVRSKMNCVHKNFIQNIEKLNVL
jgi:hypothetical protein